ncbi:hypothetical protein HORM4_520069 [Vibrio harveyi]|nr:hypothetical protein VHARVF571_310116 [Vibrio harveyi]CAK6714841.1 hypothetical protein HORM4_520069 [Vibrio harveyi]
MLLSGFLLCFANEELELNALNFDVCLQKLKYSSAFCLQTNFLHYLSQ